MTIDDRIRDTISGALGVEKSLVQPDVGLGRIPEWDSLSHLTVIVALETEYGIVFSENEVADCLTVGDLVAAVSRRSIG